MAIVRMTTSPMAMMAEVKIASMKVSQAKAEDQRFGL